MWKLLIGSGGGLLKMPRPPPPHIFFGIALHAFSNAILLIGNGAQIQALIYTCKSGLLLIFP